MKINLLLINFDDFEIQLVKETYKENLNIFSFKSSIDVQNIANIDIAIFNFTMTYSTEFFIREIQYFKSVNNSKFVLIYDLKQQFLKEAFHYHLYDYIYEKKDLLLKIDESLITYKKRNIIL